MDEIEKDLLLSQQAKKIQELEALLVPARIHHLSPLKEKLFSLLLIELEKAERKHPEKIVFKSLHMCIVTEEYLEMQEAMLKFARAINDNGEKDALITEATQVAVTALRFVGTLIDE